MSDKTTPAIKRQSSQQTSLKSFFGTTPARKASATSSAAPSSARPLVMQPQVVMTTNPQRSPAKYSSSDEDDELVAMDQLLEKHRLPVKRKAPAAATATAAPARSSNRIANIASNSTARTAPAQKRARRPSDVSDDDDELIKSESSGQYSGKFSMDVLLKDHHTRAIEKEKFERLERSSNLPVSPATSPRKDRKLELLTNGTDRAEKVFDILESTRKGVAKASAAKSWRVLAERHADHLIHTRTTQLIARIPDALVKDAQDLHLLSTTNLLELYMQRGKSIDDCAGELHQCLLGRAETSNDAGELFRLPDVIELIYRTRLVSFSQAEADDLFDAIGISTESQTGDGSSTTSPSKYSDTCEKAAPRIRCALRICTRALKHDCLANTDMLVSTLGRALSIALDPVCATHVVDELDALLDSIVSKLKMLDTALYRDALQMCLQLTPMTALRCELVTLLPTSSPTMLGFAEDLAAAYVLGETNLPSRGPARVEVLLRHVAHEVPFHPLGSDTDYEQLNLAVSILAAALRNPPRAEKRPRSKSHILPIRAATQQHVNDATIHDRHDSNEQTPYEEDPVIRLARHLDKLHGKIVDARAISITRSLCKANLQQLAHRLFYTHAAFDGSNQASAFARLLSANSTTTTTRSISSLLPTTDV